jgi:hypothetical protein
MYFNTSGYCNTALNRGALYNNTTGNNNAAIGQNSLVANTTGCYNIAIGQIALCSNTTTNSNVAIGRAALCAATSYNNIALGSKAGSVITTAHSTISVGYNTSPSNTNYHTVWGNAGNSVYNCVWVAWTNVSDCRDKANIQPLSKNLGLPFIKKLNPVSFNWDQRQRYVDVCDFEYGEKDGTLVSERKEYGIIAQDVRKALDELEEQFDGLKYNAEQDAYRFTYEALIAPLIKSVQELSERLEAIEEKLK